jgi:hypothetical protein
MTKNDRLCVNVALWPVATFVVALLGFMALRTANGAGPLPDGTGFYIPVLILVVTFGAIIAASLLRVRLGRTVC